MRVVTAAEMRELDRQTIDEVGLPGPVLMETAGRSVAQVAFALLGQRRGARVAIACGRGNNGGDGFVAGRYLLNLGAAPECFVLAKRADITGDALLHLIAAERSGLPIRELGPDGGGALALAVSSSDLTIDALLGTGLRGEVREPFWSGIESINRLARQVLAVDVPSGLDADTGAVLGQAVRATATVTLGLPKVGLLQYPGAALCGDVKVADIGIPAALSAPRRGGLRLATADWVAGILPRREPDAHKGDAGRVMIAGGAVGLTGAPAMTARAAARMGAGLVHVAVPASLHSIMEGLVLEPMSLPLPEAGPGTLGGEAAGHLLEAMRARPCHVLAVGPGLGRHPGAVELVSVLVSGSSVPVVLDADALWAVAQAGEAATAWAAPVVLTPHPGELSVLLGVSVADIQRDRVAAARGAAQRFRAIVVLKGARTVTAHPDGTAVINATGNPGMASGGMGDVLTGAIAALIAQGVPLLEAAAAGVYVHGLAADLVAADGGCEAGLLASDVIEALPRARQHAAEGRELLPGRVPERV